MGTKSASWPLAAALAIVLVWTAAAGETSAHASTAAAGYRLQPGDVLQVAVWKEQELQSEITIRPDGSLSFPLTGDVEAAGHSVEEVRAEIESRIRRYIPEGVVTVTVKTPAGNRIYVIGKVARPGDFALNRPIDVAQALSLAGGTTVYADVDSIRVLRRAADGRLAATPFRYSDIERGVRLEQNILLQGGDTVVVP
jgi:polysaccharide biosynthesis/export protein